MQCKIEKKSFFRKFIKISSHVLYVPFFRNTLIGAAERCSLMLTLFLRKKVALIIIAFLSIIILSHATLLE